MSTLIRIASEGIRITHRCFDDPQIETIRQPNACIAGYQPI
jgi:hypothetical protein